MSQYISRTELIKAVTNNEIDDFFVLNSAEAIIRDYPYCKYYIFDMNTEKFKPSRKKEINLKKFKESNL